MPRIEPDFQPMPVKPAVCQINELVRRLSDNEEKTGADERWREAILKSVRTSGKAVVLTGLTIQRT